MSEPVPEGDVPLHDQAEPASAPTEGVAGGGVQEASAPVADSEEPWLRLHSRMIWVDIVMTVLSLAPAGIAFAIVGFDGSVGALWPLVGIAVFGVWGAIADALRWVFTRYRVTAGYVERRTGIFVRRYRSVRRDRIRSVDIDARLRHRLSGLRVVTIGAGQQASSGESALVLDAVMRPDAEELRHLLMRRSPVAVAADVEGSANAGDAAAGTPWEEPGTHEPDAEVFARFDPRWTLYNMFTFWAFFMAAGLLWGGYWLVSMFGVDLVAELEQLVDWGALGMARTVAIAVVAAWLVGVIGMGLNFVAINWKFELARIPGEDGTLLRTKKGLFRTREVSRADSRLRGIQISEPLLWRWIGMADTNVITTGLSLWSSAQPSTILPRGPISVARPVAIRVLEADPEPIQAELTPHSTRALARRLWWATYVTIVGTAVVSWGALQGAWSATWMWSGVALWAVSLLAAVIAYRALGHAIVGKYLVVRSGLMARATTVLDRSSVSTIAVRESILQRRLGLRTVSTMTAAGYGIYTAPDLEADAAVGFAAKASLGLLDEFLEPVEA